MGIALDTDLIIRAERGNYDLTAFFARCGPVPIWISAVTVAELYHGVERAAGQRRADRQKHVSLVLESVSTLPYTETTARIHARIWSQLASTGLAIGAPDFMIAATCLEHDLDLATFNVRHFCRVPGLRLIDPAAQ
jgi:predicted nucleic acid-binding protein